MWSSAIRLPASKEEKVPRSSVNAARNLTMNAPKRARVNERDRAWSSVVERVERGVAAASVVRAWYERGYLGTARARIRVFERGDIV